MMAENVPSVGYKTFYIQPSSRQATKTEKHFQKEVTNQYYRITFSNGGISSIYDKELGRELIDSMKFKAGEVFTLNSIGNGAGEFSDIQTTDMAGYDKTGNYATKWEVEEDGAVFTTYKFRQPIRYAVVEQHVKLYHQQKRIDFETELLNWEGVLYREFRMAIPLKMSDGQVAYEVPFGVVNVGKDEMAGAAGERYTTPCKNIHPRGIMNWISSSNADFGVTLSSSVAVADWIDPTDHPIANQILQPILMASRKSCHGEGNEYLQTGNHAFRFSLTSHQPGWENSAFSGVRSNEMLSTVIPAHQFENASLPESMSFFRADGRNVVLSTLKKAEDNDGTVVRLVDFSGKDQSLKIESFKPFKVAGSTNLIEQDMKPLEMNGSVVKLNLGHHAIETLLLK
jgi:alpha-mannosidase